MNREKQGNDGAFMTMRINWSHRSGNGFRLSRIRCCLAFLLVSSGLGMVAGCSSAPGETGSDLSMRTDIGPLVDAIENELNRILPAAGMPVWSEADAAATRARFLFVVAGWKGTEMLLPTATEPSRQLTRQVVLFADPETRQIAVLVEVTDDEGRRLADRQEAIEELVGDVVSAEQARFRNAHPGVAVQQRRDQLGPAMGTQ